MRPPPWRPLATLLLLGLAAVAQAAAARKPLIIADGGSSCAKPANTLEAYQRAIDEGVDFVTITVASTKDREFVARPALTLGSNTNIKDLREFNSIKRSVQLGGGRKASGYFASDMTLEQIRTLYATQSFAERDQSQDRKYRVATLSEVLGLVNTANGTGKKVGVVVQILDPAYHTSANLATYTQVLAALLSAGFKDTFSQRVKIQSYDLKVLADLAEQLQALGLQHRDSLVWMVHCSKSSVSDAQLAAFSKIGSAIAPDKELLQTLTFAEECGKLISPPCWKTGQHCTGKLKTPLSSANKSPPSDLLTRAHAVGLAVYPFAFRNEGRFMAVDFASDMQQELNYFAGPKGLGVDGVYTDCSRTTNEWLQLMAAQGLLPGLASSNPAAAAAGTVADSANNAAASVAAAASKAADKVKAVGVKTWAFGVVAGGALLILLIIGAAALRSNRRRANQYRAWKEAGLSQALDADLPVSTGAVWGLQKNTWSSQASEADEPAAAPSRSSSLASRDSGRSGDGRSRKLKTYSGMLDSYAHSARRP